MYSFGYHMSIRNLKRATQYLLVLYDRNTNLKKRVSKKKYGYGRHGQKPFLQGGQEVHTSYIPRTFTIVPVD